MTIGIDIRVLGSGRKSGIEEYTEQLLAHMLPLDPSVQYKLFYSSHANPLPDFDWLKLPNVDVVKLHIPNRALFYSGRFFGIPKIDRLIGGVDVFFSPHFLYTPLSVGCRRVTTFHDLSFERFPEFFSLRQRIWHKVMKPDWQARFSDALIAVSDSTRSDLINLYSIDPVKVVRIYSGIAPSIKRPEEKELKRFKDLNDLPERYILYLGTLEPRKNIGGLIKAFTLLKKADGMEDVRLAVVGPAGWLYDDIFRTVQNSPDRKSITFVGSVRPEERAYYYSLASLFVYPSFFEGFGLPPLEAMACGAPVVTSHNSSLPEVVGTAGVLIDPYNIAEMARAMESVLRDKQLQTRLISEGSRRAGLFTWDRCARETLAVLKG